MSSYKHVFADPSQKRWRKARRFLFYFAAVATVLLVIFMLSVLLNPFLNTPNLALNVKAPQRSHIHRQSRREPVTARERRFERARARLFSSQTNGKSVPFVVPPRQREIPDSAFYVNWDEASYTSLTHNLRNVDRLYPQWISLNDSDGNLGGMIDKKVGVLLAKRRPIPVIPAFANFNFTTEKWMGDELTRALRTPASRARMQDQILGFIDKYDFAGVLIDLELMKPSAQKGYEQFVTSLANAVHAKNKIIDVAVPPSATDFFDYAKLAQTVDHLVLMAYDEHAEGSGPGPICSIEWLDGVLKQRVKQIPPAKLIVGLGAYGYDWDLRTGHAHEVTFEEAMVLANESSAEIDFDDRSLNSTFQYRDGDGHEHAVWYLDAPSIYNQIQVAERYAPAGVAVWRLGAEDPALWDILEEHNRARVVKALETVQPGYELVYEGEGEMLRVMQNQRTGRRVIDWDKDTPLIADQTMTELPLPYTIGRYGLRKKRVAISFDDGPDPKYTPEVLRILRENNAKAVFFVIGINAESDRDIIKRAFQEGNEIGNHTFTHPDIADIPPRQLELELNACQRLIQSILGRNTILFRPPFNVDTDPRTPDEGTPIAAASKMGYLTVGSQCDTEDYRQAGVQTIVDTALSQIKDGSIIMMHDSGGAREQTIQALPIIIKEVRARGYEIVSLSELLGRTRDELMPPLSASERVMDLANTMSFGIGEFLLYAHRWLLALGVGMGILRFAIYALMAPWQKWRRRETSAPYEGPVDVVVPAFNEEKVIIYTIKSLLQSRGIEPNIIVVNDGSTDNTLKVLEEHFGNEKRVRILNQLNGGKAAALNHGISKTTAPVIITLDSDTIFQHDCVRELVKPFNDPTVSAVAGNAKVGNRINIITRWQALEYITSQNLDRRAHELINCITVVPGAVGAWRRSVLTEVGGYAGDTLAEDGELTIRVLKGGGHIKFAEGAIAWTEAPENLRNLIRQRFRWMYGTFQTFWKHRKLLFRKQYGSLGVVGMPMIFLFQVFFPFTAPLMDLTMYLVTVFYIVQKGYHPEEFSSDVFRHTLFFYSLFLLFDMATAVVSMALEKDREDWTLLVWLPWQRFFYRQLMHIIAIKSIYTAVKGRVVEWGHITRNASHVEHFTESGLSEADPKTIHEQLEDRD